MRNEFARNAALRVEDAGPPEATLSERARAAAALSAALKEETAAVRAQARLQVERARRLAAETSGLTPRQREVLTLVAYGHTNKQIAGRLRLSLKTVEMHRQQGMQRIAARHLSEVVQWARSEGLFPLRRSQSFTDTTTRVEDRLVGDQEIQAEKAPRAARSSPLAPSDP